MSACKKIAYTRGAALRALMRIDRKHGMNAREKRIYRCPKCKAFHLTSRPAVSA